MRKFTKYLNMKTLFGFIFSLFFLAPSLSFSQIRMSGMENISLFPNNGPATFVRKEVVVTQSFVEQGPSQIIVSNKIKNAKVYGTDQGVRVDLENTNEKKEVSNQIVIDLAEAKKEQDLASSKANKFTTSTLADPNLLGFIFFDENSSKLRAEHQQELLKIKEVLSDNPTKNIQIVGHADVLGVEQGNEDLAFNRAQFIYNYLTQVYKLDPKRFELNIAQENFFQVQQDGLINVANQSEKNRSVSFILKETATSAAKKENKIKTPEEQADIEVPSSKVNYNEGQVVGFVFFDENSKKVQQQYYAELFKLNTVVETMPEKQIIIIGHGEVNGIEKSNASIAKERADAVLYFLTSIFKMDPSRFVVYTEGENNFEVPKENKIYATTDAEKNRSVTIILK